MDDGQARIPETRTSQGGVDLRLLADEENLPDSLVAAGLQRSLDAINDDPASVVAASVVDGCVFGCVGGVFGAGVGGLAGAEVGRP